MAVKRKRKADPEPTGTDQLTQIDDPLGADLFATMRRIVEIEIQKRLEKKANGRADAGSPLQRNRA